MRWPAPTDNVDWYRIERLPPIRHHPRAHAHRLDRPAWCGPGATAKEPPRCGTRFPTSAAWSISCRPSPATSPGPVSSANPCSSRSASVPTSRSAAGKVHHSARSATGRLSPMRVGSEPRPSRRLVGRGSNLTRAGRPRPHGKRSSPLGICRRQRQGPIAITHVPGPYGLQRYRVLPRVA